MKTVKNYLVFSLLIMPFFASATLTLEQAIKKAHNVDPWLKGNEMLHYAEKERSVSAGSLPDPKVSITAANLPTDGFDFNQEPMTQLKIGVSQMLPRGNTLTLNQEKLRLSATKFPVLEEDRKANVTTWVTLSWLDAYEAQQKMALILKERVLFEQMVDIASVNYSSASGKTRQQDVIRAQLELVQLDDRITVLEQQQQVAMTKLNQWLLPYQEKSFHLNNSSLQFTTVAQKLPELSASYGLQLIEAANIEKLSNIVSNHPTVLTIDVKQQVANKDIDISKEQFKPQWGLNASYAYRDDADSGMSRSDFFSFGVNFDVPLFTKNFQERNLNASIAKAEVVKTEKLLKMKSLISDVMKETKNLRQLEIREALYSEQLTHQSHEQAEAALSAYTNDDGNFSDVVGARIAELNIKIAALKINIDKLKTIARLNYALTQSANGHR